MVVVKMKLHLAQPPEAEPVQSAEIVPVIIMGGIKPAVPRCAAVKITVPPGHFGIPGHPGLHSPVGPLPVNPAGSGFEMVGAEKENMNRPRALLAPQARHTSFL